MASYHVKCRSPMDREILNHYSLRMTAALQGMRWHTSADVSMHGKYRMSMMSDNAVILNLSIDDMRKLIDAASPSPVIIKVQCYRDLMAFSHPTVSGIYYEAYNPGHGNPMAIYGISMPELSTSIFYMLTKERIKYIDTDIIINYLRQEFVMLRCFASAIKVKTAGDVMDNVSCKEQLLEELKIEEITSFTQLASFF